MNHHSAKAFAAASFAVFFAIFTISTACYGSNLAISAALSPAFSTALPAASATYSTNFALSFFFSSLLLTSLTLLSKSSIALCNLLVSEVGNNSEGSFYEGRAAFRRPVTPEVGRRASAGFVNIPLIDGV